MFYDLFRNPGFWWIAVTLFLFLYGCYGGLKALAGRLGLQKQRRRLLPGAALGTVLMILALSCLVMTGLFVPLIAFLFFGFILYALVGLTVSFFRH